MAMPRVLIVEDDAMMADTIASMVELFGYETVIFNDPKGAIDAARREHPDVVLLDLNLPGEQSGIEICKQIKADGEVQKTPVIIVSADSQPETIEKAKAAGAARYLVKPVGLDDLELAIAETLRELGIS
jgi:CheY-like chemotaxis protein